MENLQKTYLRLKTKNDEKAPQHQKYSPPNFTDIETEQGEVIAGEWRSQLGDNRPKSIGSGGAHRATKSAYDMRDTLSEYFMTAAGGVPWQYDYVRRGKYHDVP